MKRVRVKTGDEGTEFLKDIKHRFFSLGAKVLVEKTTARTPVNNLQEMTKPNYLFK